jgi:demethylmenaquinone methyltransferase/2-methoxy-6-polyprenyl-1,4-benzoquinol methylase
VSEARRPRQTDLAARRRDPGLLHEALIVQGPAAPHRVLARYYPDHEARPAFVTDLFDAAAPHYDWVCRVMALGSGQSYRRQALVRAGLAPGMKLLDIATGTGLVARSAARMLDGPGAVIGLDASAGMLREAGKHVAMPLVQGHAEHLPFRSDSFDLASMGYALRHMADLGVTSRECLRVLKPGGRLLVLEISRPRSAAGLWATRVYLRGLLPAIARLATRSRSVETLARYHWDTIAECVPPETILAVLRASGFVDVERRVFAGVISEYAAVKPRA